MFEELGYELYNNNEMNLRYYNPMTDLYIWFDKVLKTIEILEDFDIKVLQAINKQVEELGWK